MALAAATACAGVHRESAPTDVALYRARVEPAGGRAVSFRVLLYCALPDRLHAEVLGPMGGPQLVVDGGGGRLAVTFPAEGVAYAGEADAESVGQVIGVRLALPDLVAFVAGGTPPPAAGLRAERDPPAGPGLPRRFRLSADEGSIAFERRGGGPRAPVGPDVGTGRPPAGVTLHPLADLPRGELPVLGEAAAGPAP